MQTSLYHRLRSLSHNPNECFYFGKLKREIRQNASFGEESHIIMKPPGKLNTVLMIQGVVFFIFKLLKTIISLLRRGSEGQISAEINNFTPETRQRFEWELVCLQNSWVVKQTALCSSVFTYV